MGKCLGLWGVPRTPLVQGYREKETNIGGSGKETDKKHGGQRQVD